MSTAQIAESVKDAAGSGDALRICGRGEWLDGGRPVRAAKTLSLGGDAGIVSYVPGDLVMSARAGTTLADIQRATAEHDQWLPLDPYGSSTGTIGATISTASAGPLATAFGLPRDLVLGLEFVSGRGETIRSGGKVVKNVAGFDLSRLITGSWGTLGVITEVTLRLYARPKSDRTFIVRLSQNAKELSAFLLGFLAAPVNPFAFELLSGTTTAALGLGNAPRGLIRFGGNSAAVESQINALTALSPAEEVDAGVWDTLRCLEGHSECVVRVSGLPARFRSAAPTILADTYPEILTYINPVRGTLRLVMRQSSNGESTEEAIRGLDQGPASDDHVVFEKLPAEVWPTVPGLIDDPLSQGIKRTFDPHNVLNPGILGN